MLLKAAGNALSFHDGSKAFIPLKIFGKFILRFDYHGKRSKNAQSSFKIKVNASEFVE